MKRKVVISAEGIATTLGDSFSEILEKAGSGNVGIHKIADDKIANSFCKYLGTIDYIDEKKLKIQGKNLLNRVNKILSYAFLKSLENYDTAAFQGNDGLFIGTQLQYIDSGMLKAILENCTTLDGIDISLMGSFLNKTSPISGLKLLPTVPSHTFSKNLGLHGNGNLFYAGRTSGIANLCLAYEEIAYGRMDHAIVGSAFSVVDDYEIFESCGSKIAKRNENSDSDSKIICPFDKKHSGSCYAEGASCLILESEEVALKNNNEIICYVDGFAINSFPENEIAELSSLGFINVMKNACKSADISFDDIDCVYTNANSYPNWDDAELKAISEVGSTHKFRVANTKYALGDSNCASGIIDCALAAYSIKNNCNFPQQPHLQFNEGVSARLRECFNYDNSINRVIVNNAGEYGNYCSVILSKYGEKNNE